MRQLDVLCVGIACADVLMRGVDFSVPFDDESKAAELTALSVGGDALNQATVLTRLGHKVGLVVGVGDDLTGRMLQDEMGHRGVDTAGFIKTPGPSILNIIVIAPDGQRNFINGGMPPSAWFEPDDRQLETARIVSLGSLMCPPFDRPALANAVAARAKAAGATVVADCSFSRELEAGLDAFAPALAATDYLLPNDGEALRLTGAATVEQAAETLRGYGVGAVVIKTGGRGCYLLDEAGGRHIPTYSHVPVVDTTGAGDNFVSGFMHGLLEGMDAEAACRFGCGVASVAIQVMGASTGVQSLEQVHAAIGRFEKGEL